MAKIVKKCPHPHTSIGPFYKCVKDFFNSRVYPFNTSVIGSFDKAIQFLDDLKRDPSVHREGPYLPLISYMPLFTEPVPQTDFLWKFSDLHPFEVAWNQTPIITQDGSQLYITTRRMIGTIDFRVFAESYMEIHDIYMQFLDVFRTFNKWMYMPLVKQSLILSDDIRLNTDEYGEITIDWSKTSIGNKLIPSINQNRYYLPLDTMPLIQLQSCSDSSMFYGGSSLPEYALTGSLQYELEIPTMVTLLTDSDVLTFDTTIEGGFIPEWNNPSNSDNPNSPLNPNNPNYDPNGNDDMPQTIPGVSTESPFQWINDVEYIDWNDISSFVGTSVIERNDPTTGLIAPEMIRVLNEHTFTVEVENQQVQYPICFEVTFDLNPLTTLVMLNGDIIYDYYIKDEHSVILTAGPNITSGSFEVKILKFKKMMCCSTNGRC